MVPHESRRKGVPRPGGGFFVRIYLVICMHHRYNEFSHANTQATTFRENNNI